MRFGSPAWWHCRPSDDLAFHPTAFLLLLWSGYQLGFGSRLKRGLKIFSPLIWSVRSDPHGVKGAFNRVYSRNRFGQFARVRVASRCLIFLACRLPAWVSCVESMSTWPPRDMWRFIALLTRHTYGPFPPFLQIHLCFPNFLSNMSPFILYIGHNFWNLFQRCPKCIYYF